MYHSKWFEPRSISSLHCVIVRMSVVVQCKCKFNVKHKECLRDNPSQRLMIKCLTIIQIEISGIWKCWFLRRGENRSTLRKTSRSKEENQQQTPPTYDAVSGNRTRDTLVEGERSHHCAIPAPQVVWKELLLVTDVLTTCPEVSFRVKWECFSVNTILAKLTNHFQWTGLDDTSSTDKLYSLTLKMTSDQVVETSVSNSSSVQNYPHPDDHTWRTRIKRVKPRGKCRHG